MLLLNIRLKSFYLHLKIISDKHKTTMENIFSNLEFLMQSNYLLVELFTLIDHHCCMNLNGFDFEN
jgi:hypothetical protein